MYMCVYTHTHTHMYMGKRHHNVSCIYFLRLQSEKFENIIAIINGSSSSIYLCLSMKKILGHDYVF